MNDQAIRNTPTVILHQSVDDGYSSESEYSRTGTPAFDTRLVSPPPPPRVVAEAQQLPTCTLAEYFAYIDQSLTSTINTGIPDSDSDATSEEGDVDEPTVTAGSSSARLRTTAPRAFPLHTQQASQKDERERPSVRPAQDASLRGSLRPTSTFSTSPFTNLQVRNDSALILGEHDVSNKLNHSSGCNSSVGLHKRSRSVVSFFSLISPSPSLSTSSTNAINPSSSDALVREEGERSVTVRDSSALTALNKDKKAGRLRKVFGRLFR